jgi:hypothetical protein
MPEQRGRDSGRTALGARTARGVLLAVLAGALLAACGGGSVDAGGFSAGDRSAAQNALDQLEGTAIPTTLVSLSATAGAIPQVCQVHRRGNGEFGLFLFWQPVSTQQAFTWLTAMISGDNTKDRFHLGFAPGQSSGAKLLRTAEGDAFLKPTESCEILKNGFLRLVRPPATTTG